jgi:hypothetical protein
MPSCSGNLLKGAGFRFPLQRPLRYPHRKITSIDGATMKRFIVIAFDNVETAGAWSALVAQKEINTTRSEVWHVRLDGGYKGLQSR